MRDLDADLLADFLSQSSEPALLGEFYFDSGTQYMWTGYGTLTWNGNDYLGAGNFVGISAIEETQDTQAKGITLSTNGASPTAVAAALTEKIRGRKFRMYLTEVVTRRYILLEDGTGSIALEDGTGYIALENITINTPYRIFSGLMDYMEFTDDGIEPRLQLSVENALIIGQRPKIGRYTTEDQKRRYPADKGLDFINQLQDKEIVW